MKKKIKKRKTTQPKAGFDTNPEGILDIDERILDVQSSEQPRLVWLWNKRLGKALVNIDYAEMELKIATAQIDEAIRLTPKRYGLDNVTEAGVKVAILRTKRYRTSVENLIALRQKMYDIKAVCDALDHRRTSLSHFVNLRDQSYFSSPRKGTSGPDGPGWEERQTRRNSKKKGAQQ